MTVSWTMLTKAFGKAFDRECIERHAKRQGTPTILSRGGANRHRRLVTYSTYGLNSGAIQFQIDIDIKDD